MTQPAASGTTKNTVPPELDLTAWAGQHARALTIGAIAVVLVVGGGWLYVTSEQRKETFAAQALGQARSSAEAGNMPLAASDLARLIERYGGTRSADEATILINQIRLLQGQSAVAVSALQAFVRGGHPDYMIASAYGLLGGGLEDQGKLNDAGAAYRKAADAAPHDFLKAQYLLDAGRALANAGDSAAARAAYGEVLQKYGQLQQAAEARVRMAEIGGTVPRAPARPTRREAGGPEAG